MPKWLKNWQRRLKNWRINLVLIVFLLFAGLVLNRLFFLQVIKRGFYQSQALGQQTRLEEFEAARGEIFFKNKEKSLAINKDRWRVYVEAREIEKEGLTSQKLSEVLEEDKETILSKIKEGKYYTIIKNDLKREEVRKIENLNLPGVKLETYPGRYYPQKELASHIIGFLGGDKKGQYGIEGYYDKILRGEEGFKEEKTGILKYFFDSSDDSEIQEGKDIYLTIDYNIQFKAESLLREAKENLDIESGQIIVMNPNSGEIIALANFPNFDPNYYSEQKNLGIFQNGAIQKLFEPGSAFKPITMAIAIEEGKVTPETTYKDVGYVKVGVETIYNYDRRVWGQSTMTEVLEKSINTGAVFVQQKVPHHVFIEYIDKLGLSEKTGIELQGEVNPSNRSLRSGRDINFATASFGQGINMTPIQFIKVFSAVINGGKLIQPYLVEKIIDDKGNQKKKEPNILREVFSQKTSSQLSTMLISVVEDGFGKAAKIPGYYIGGKTGTAQVAYENKEGYYPNKTIQSFIGFAPALNPQFLILVKLNNPKTKTAEYSAVPLFQRLAKYIIDYWQIPPDYTE